MRYWFIFISKFISKTIIKFKLILTILTIIPNFCDNISYKTIDKFIELNDDNESIEIKIMKKYPSLNNIDACYDCSIVFDQFTKEKYLIVSNII